MFSEAAVSISVKRRASGPDALSEVIAGQADLGDLALARGGPLASAPAAVGAYIGAAYWFTSSTSFANPAIDVGRMFSNTFAGIAPSSVPVFIAAQIGGGIAGVAIIKILTRAHLRPGSRGRRPDQNPDGQELPGLAQADGEVDGRRPQGWTDRQQDTNRKKEVIMHMVAIGGSDAWISAALRAREVDPGAEVTGWWPTRTRTSPSAGSPITSPARSPTGATSPTDHRRPGGGRMRLRLDTTARSIDTAGHKLLVTGPDGAEDLIAYDQLVIGTGAVPARPPIAGLATLGPGDRVHLLHSMGDTFALTSTLTETSPPSAVIVGAGYIGLEMADALTTRGLAVTQIEQLPEVLPTVDPQLGALVHAELAARGVEILTGTAVNSVGKAEPGAPGRLQVEAVTNAGGPATRHADLGPSWSASAPTPAWP